jgi:hypothetical protein
MRRRIVTATLAIAAGILAACTDKLPTSPTVDGDAFKASINVDGCVDATLKPITAQVDLDVKDLITDLFADQNHRSSTLTMWENLKKDKLESRPLLNHINSLTKWTLEKLSTNALSDPDAGGNLNATTGSVRLLDLVFRCAGETPTQVPEPPAGFDALFKLVAAGEFGTFATSFNDAAAFIPQNALEDNTLLVLVRQPEDVIVNTPFPKVSRTVDVALAGGRIKPGQNLSVLFCPLENVAHERLPRLVVAHQFAPPSGSVGVGVEYLPPSQDGELDCPHGVASLPQMEKNVFKRSVMHAASFAGKALGLLGPKTLYAGHAAIGGLLSFSDDEGGFSPMVVVDPFVETSITDVVIPTTTYGETVEFDATLRVSNVPVACAPGATIPAVCTWVGQPVTQALAGMPALVLADLKITAALQDQSQANPIDGTGKAHFVFTGLDAGDAAQTATLTFPPTLNDAANAPSFGGSNTTAQYTVNRRPLSVTADAHEWVYGTPETPTGTFTGAVQYGESVTPSYTTTQNAMTEVGTYPGALVADVIFGSGVRPENYAVTKTNATLTIVQAPLTVTANDKTREYGLANPTFDATVVGIKNGDVHTEAPTTGANSDSDVGTYPITPTITGPRIERNYDITYVNGTLTITPAPLNVVIANKSRQYGDENPALTANAWESQIRSDDALTLNLTTLANAASPVGNHPITGTITGDEVGNYAVVIPNGTLEITHRPLTVTVGSQSLVYGAPITFSATNSAVNGDVITYSFTTTPDGVPNVGNYSVGATVGGATSNYAPIIVVPGALEITARPITITVNSATRVQGAANPAFGGVVGGAGLLGTDGVTVSYTSAADENSAPNAYDIDAALVGGASTNYSASITKGILTVTAAGPSIASMTLSSSSISIDNSTTSYTAVLNNPGASSSSWTLVGSLTQDAVTQPAGFTTINCGAGSGILSSGNCNEGFSIAGKTLTSNLLTAGPATFRLELRKDNVLVDFKTTAVTMVP